MRRKIRKKIKPQYISMILEFYESLERLGLCDPKNKTLATDRIVDIATSNLK